MPAKKSPGSNHFPLKLHELLDDAGKMGHSHVICWCPDGQSFRINDPKALVPVLNKYFRQTKYKSLLRQLQGYNFKRVTSGINKGNVSHPLFRRGMRSKCSQIKRKQNKASSDASSNRSPKASSVDGNTVKKDAKSERNSAADHQRRQLQQKSGMDALRVEIGCTFSSAKKVNHNVISTSSMSSLKRSKAQEQLRPLIVQSSKSEPTILERERLSKRQRIPEDVRSCNSSGLLTSFKNSSFSFLRRASKDDTILANEKMQFQEIQQEKQKQKEFERLEKLCFSNVSQVPGGTQQFHHSHKSISAFGALDLDISLTTTTTTHYNGGDSQVSSSTISKNFVFPADLEPTPMLSPRREAKASSGITLSCNIDFPSESENTNNQKIYQDIVVKLPPAPTPTPFGITSSECTSAVGDSSFGLSSEVSDEIDEDIAETFGEDVDTNGCSPVVFDTEVEGQNEEDEQDDWTKGVVYGGKADCVLEPDKFQIEVQRLQFGKLQQQLPQQKQIRLQQPSRLEHNFLRRQLEQQQTMMQQQGRHNIPPQHFQLPQRRILSCQQPRHLQMNAPYALLSRPIPLGHDDFHRQIQLIKR